MIYPVRIPKLAKWLIPGYTWMGPAADNAVYPSFDDGPNPEITPFILEQLKKHRAKATFFCLGKNVDQFPELYHQILAEGHQVGNHTQHHLNGWKTPVDSYVRDVREAALRIRSSLFRPPYGKISPGQFRILSGSKSERENESPASRETFQVIMWDVLSGDFDPDKTGEKCQENVISHSVPGSIIVFHDSRKAWERMRVALPGCLDYFGNKKWPCHALPEGNSRITAEG
ncbi:MAG TPA: polysaccharide deacetylase family protein [Chitinophagaceae bacterium]|nr:polysaccharide deacetylase family protein [Chitinophagaceae bacterium]